MAAGKDERRKSRKSESQNEDEEQAMGLEEEQEPDFSDPADFVDDVTDEGKLFLESRPDTCHLLTGKPDMILQSRLA